MKQQQFERDREPRIHLVKRKTEFNKQDKYKHGFLYEETSDFDEDEFLVESDDDKY